MSKIHEALKKAQEERSHLVPVAPQDVPLDLQMLPEKEPQAAPAAKANAVNAPSADTARAGTSGQLLRFEDLLKQCAQPVWQPDANAIVFSGLYGPGQGAEQFRTLRTRLYQMRDISPLKRVLITSAIAGEGKTFVATNLVQAIACERDRKVLLIDGDLRSARLHLPLGAPLSPGLAEYLRDEASETEVIQHGQAGNLCFIAGGKNGEVNASELLSNGRLPRLLNRVSSLFDWVVIDSPPCLPVADASVLAGFADGLLLVVKASSTPSAIVQKAREELRKGNVLGVVLNAVNEAHGYGGYYAYSYGAETK